MTDQPEIEDFTSTERRALDEWTSLAPPEDFVDRVLAARTAPAVRARRLGWPTIAIAGGLGLAAAVALTIIVLRGGNRSGRGEVAATSERTATQLGDRGVAVAEADAQLTWREDEAGNTEVEQRAGNVFYRVEHDGPFVIHTPGGDVRVTGTCLRVEVEPMKPTKQMIISGVVGAALASAVIVTVYEGHVLAESKGKQTELSAGTRATFGGSEPIAVGRGELDTHEDLAARGTPQQAQIVQLRARISELEQQLTEHGGPDRHDRNDRKPVPGDGEDGRPWHDPSPETLVDWAAKCHVRFDEPTLDHFSPFKNGDDTERGLEPGEVEGYNAAMTEMAKQWHDLVHALYIEATGDTAGADTLSVEAMRHEIEEKSPHGERSQILQQIARERAGLAQAPSDSARLSPLERLTRAFAAIGNQSEAALAKRVGAARAKAIRGDGWGSKSDMSGCPK